MATIQDNIMEMAMLVRAVRDASRLSEATILRIVDMNFALAQQARGTAPATFEDIPLPDEFDETGVLAGVEGTTPPVED